MTKGEMPMSTIMVMRRRSIQASVRKMIRIANRLERVILGGPPLTSAHQQQIEAAINAMQDRIIAAMQRKSCDPDGFKLEANEERTDDQG